MSKILKVIVSVTALLTLTSPLFAQSSNWVMVGGLSCSMSPTIGLLVVSEQKLNCTFTPSGSYPPEHYAGTMGTVGIDVGVIGGGLLAWAVYMPRARHKGRSPAPMAGRAVVLLQEWVPARTSFWAVQHGR